MSKSEKIKMLSEFKELQVLKLAAEKRYKELKAEIEENLEAGQYGDYALGFEFRDVKEYTVSARTDKIIKVIKK